MGKSGKIASETSAKSEGMLRGAACWIAFSVLAVALRGVRWDENFEFAQAMIGAVPYPPEHPLMQYTRSAFNGQIMASAALLKLFPDPAILNGVRNFVFVLASTLPGYLLGHVMGRRPLTGHVTAVMLLIGVHLELDAAYPQFIWPGMFSNGHIGTGYVLAWVALTAGGYYRVAGLMLGLLPAVHLGQMPPTLLLAGGLVLYAITLDRERWTQMKTGLPWFGGGILFCMMLYAVHRFYVLPPVTEGPYFSHADPHPIWQGRIQFWDMHRQIALGGMGMVLACAAALLMLLRGTWTAAGQSDAGAPTRWLPLIYAVGCVAPIVITIMILHAASGTDVPYLLIGWLPYRLLNHLPPILIAASVALLMHQQDKKPWVVSLPALMLLGYALRPLAKFILGENLYFRYLHQPTALLFMLAGAALAVLALESVSRDKKIVAVATFAVVLGYTALAHQFGAACLALGGVLVWTGTRFPTPKLSCRQVVWATQFLLGLLLVNALYQENADRTHLPVGDFEQRVADYLEESAEPDALLVAGPEQVLLQAQTGHPVMADLATAFHASYMPSLGPSVQKFYLDLYGIRFDLSPTEQLPWGDVWQARPVEAWNALGRAYGFRYVVAPASLSLQLESVVEGELDTLYRLSPP